MTSAMTTRIVRSRRAHSLRIAAVTLVCFVILSVGITGVVPSAIELVRGQTTGLAFGEVAVGDTQQQSAGIYALGTNTRDVTVSSIQVTGPHADEFRVVDSGGTPFRLAPGASRHVVVEFTPKTPGAKSATLTFVSDADTGPMVYQIQATATGSDPWGMLLKTGITVLAAGGAGVGATVTLSRRRKLSDEDDDAELSEVADAKTLAITKLSRRSASDSYRYRDGDEKGAGEATDESTILFSKLSRTEQARIRGLTDAVVSGERPYDSLSQEDQFKVYYYQNSGRGYEMGTIVRESLGAILWAAPNAVKAIVTGKRTPKAAFATAVDTVTTAKDDLIDIFERHTEGRSELRKKR